MGTTNVEGRSSKGVLPVTAARSVLSVLLLLAAHDAWAQAQRQAPVRVSTMAVYQRYADQRPDRPDQVEELTVPFTVNVAPTPELRFVLTTSAASAGGGGLATLQGLGDVQASASYLAEVGAARLAFTLQANLPSGKQELTADEFEAASLLSQTFYGFRLPSFGQGFSVGPALMAAVPVSEHVVVGLGGSYQAKGSYTPVEGLAGDYEPGDQLLLVGGLDVRLNPATSLSFDATLTRYGADQVGEAETYQAGPKATGAVQLLRYVGFDVLRVALRYRGQGKSDVLGRGRVVGEVQTVPAQADLRVSYDRRAGRALRTTLVGSVRYYEAVSLFDEQVLVDLGLQPRYQISPEVAVRGVFTYTLGTFSGFEAGLGLAFTP